jgi:hypothetical protein
METLDSAAKFQEASFVNLKKTAWIMIRVSKYDMFYLIALSGFKFDIRDYFMHNIHVRVVALGE